MATLLAAIDRRVTSDDISEMNISVARPIKCRPDCHGPHFTQALTVALPAQLASLLQAPLAEPRPSLLQSRVGSVAVAGAT